MLIPDDVKQTLIENGRKSRMANEKDELFDPYPVVKLFTPDAGATWLLTELDPDDPDIAFGLCDLGLGFPELGSVRLSELEQVRGKLNLSVERDRHFKPRRSLMAYANKADRAGYIDTNG